MATALKPKAGFTLIEAILYIAIFSVVLVALLSFLSHVLLAETKVSLSNTLRSSATQALELMTYYGRKAEGASLDGGVLTLDEEGELTRTFSVVSQGDYDQLIFTDTDGSVTPMTSDLVTVDVFDLTLLSEVGRPPSVQILLTLSPVHSDQGYPYNTLFTAHTAFTLRKEITP